MAPAAQPDAFSLELNYWGHPRLGWRIGADGEGEFRAADPPSSGIVQEYALVTRRFNAGEAGFQEIRALMDRAARLTAPTMPCRKVAYDQVYGRANWHRGARSVGINFDFGCGNRVAQQVMGLLGEATTLIQGWASNQPIVETQQIRGPAPE
ncbi:MAG: hypothetical protein M3177_10175 [Pseudomonadota bacterium]|nr:hypothetical protein [Pseudomonadota bacterium]